MIINCTVEEVVNKLQKNNISFERDDISSQRTELKFENSDQLDIININKDYSYTHYVINVFFEISDNNFDLKVRGFHSLSGDDYKKDSKIETSKIVDKLFKLLKISNF